MKHPIIHNFKRSLLACIAASSLGRAAGDDDSMAATDTAAAELRNA